MNIKNYLRTWTWLQTENRWSRIIIAGIVACNMLLAYKVLVKETVVTIHPFTLTEEAWVGQKSASRSYIEAWGFAYALMLGNVTPATAEFIAERIKPFLAPRIYQEVLDLLHVQAQQIKDDRISIRFEPRTVEYEFGRNKTFIYGYSYIKGATGQEQRTERTYEFELSINRYAPMIHYLETYSGRPRTKSFNERLDRREEQEKAKEQKRSRVDAEIDRQTVTGGGESGL